MKTSSAFIKLLYRFQRRGSLSDSSLGGSSSKIASLFLGAAWSPARMLAGCASQAQFTPTSASCSAESLAVLNSPASLCLICRAAPHIGLGCSPTTGTVCGALWLRSTWQPPECIPLGSGHTHPGFCCVPHPKVLLCAPSQVLLCALSRSSAVCPIPGSAVCPILWFCCAPHPQVLLCTSSQVFLCVPSCGTHCAAGTARRHQAVGAIATEGLAGEHITAKVEG